MSCNIKVLVHLTCGINKGETAKPKVIHVNRVWRYHGLGNNTWDNNVESEVDEDVVEVQEQARADERVNSDIYDRNVYI